MVLLQRMMRLAAVVLTVVIVGAYSAAKATAQQGVDPRMASYYQQAGAPGGMPPMGYPGGEEGPEGVCPYCGGAGCQACGGQGYIGGDGGGDDHIEALAVGSFIDSAIPLTQVRVRYDRAINFQKFDRAEYFFPTTVANGGQLPAAETVLDLQEITTTLEVALTDRFSMFVDLPGRIVESDSAPAANGGLTRDGFGDMRAGGKLALIACDRHFLTAEGTVFMPTGDAAEALGTGHTSIEGGLLYWGRYGERITIEAEIKDWVATNSPTIPGNGLYGGNVLQYGVGVGYDAVNTCEGKVQTRLTGVAEFVGWTVLDGFESGGAGVTDARGETIINGFFGARATHGQQSFYAGYGRQLSNDYWYKEIYRLEYSWRY